MDTEQTIRTFIDFYRERGHTEITGTTLIPGAGESVLFTSAGMQPLTPYLEGRAHPLGTRLVDVQRCLRTTDLEEVGDSRHLTMFEMLGSWSLGDYGSGQSLRWGYELLTERFKVDPRLLHVTVFGGAERDRLGADEESLRTWRDLGVPVEMTFGDENWWANGPTGPCGPDSEIFYWTGDGPPTGTPTTDERWVEIWNHVMMRYRRHPDGSLTPLDRPSIDAGMGLERMVTVLQGAPDVFRSDVFSGWVAAVEGLWAPDEHDLRVLCDHLRSAVVVIGDGVRPSNTGRGYVLRRLIRRLLTTLWRADPGRTLTDLPEPVLVGTLRHFRLDEVPVAVVREVLDAEERKFADVVRRGRQVVARRLRRGGGGPLSQADYDDLHETHGLPRELVDGLLIG